jgi:hypothetical protein
MAERSFHAEDHISNYDLNAQKGSRNHILEPF